jgi:hypothetical protein
MNIINKDALKLTTDLLKRSPNFDQEALNSIYSLTDDDVMLLLYNNMVSMNKFKKGLYNNTAEVIGSVVKSAPEGKTIISYLEYLTKKSNESENLDKVPYLKSIEVFVNWLNAEVFVKTK